MTSVKGCAPSTATRRAGLPFRLTRSTSPRGARIALHCNVEGTVISSPMGHRYPHCIPSVLHTQAWTATSSTRFNLGADGRPVGDGTVVDASSTDVITALRAFNAEYMRLQTRLESLIRAMTHAGIKVHQVSLRHRLPRRRIRQQGWQPAQATISSPRRPACAACESMPPPARTDPWASAWRSITVQSRIRPAACSAG